LTLSQSRPKEEINSAERDAKLESLILEGVAPFRVSRAEILKSYEAESDVEPFSPEQRAKVLASLRSTQAVRRGRNGRQLSDSAASADASASTTFGALVGAGRTRLGLKVADLAALLQVQRDYIVGLEADERSPIGLGSERLCSVVRMLNIDPNAAVRGLLASMAAFTSSSSGPTLGRIDPVLTPAARRRLIEESLRNGGMSSAEQGRWRDALEAVASITT
jgi:hypothetical protein